MSSSPTPAASSKTDHASAFKILSDIKHHLINGTSHFVEPSMLTAVLDAVRHSTGIDDRKFLLEHLLVTLSHAAPDSFIAKTLEPATVQMLYNDLEHPPATFVGGKYAFRSADGSGNNPAFPDLGKSHMNYARSVQQGHPLPPHMMPDPGLVFDTLLKRDKFVKHPAGLSSLMFSFAALVIHTCFRTSHSDPLINETSSYVDLSPLYGVDQKQQDMVRVRDGRGLLKPDAFAEDRLLLLPPAVCVLLVLFSRNHNYIAEKLLNINERGTWTPTSSPNAPFFPTLTDKQIQKQDNEIFETARLVNAGWFASIVFADYFSAILGLVRQGSEWSLDPFGEIRKEGLSGLGERFERGRGNAVSVEFNCLYRWHATTSIQDEEWIQKAFSAFFGGKSPDDVTAADFRAGAVKLQAMQPDCDHWTFGGLQRGPDGRFKDEDLAGVLMNATASPASAFKARGTPHVMRLNEVMGIMQSRMWGVCSLNDFRRYLGLKPYSSFLEWNSDPEIAATASKLYYDDIENLELYVGLQAEEAKPLIEGAGLCPGYTISRAILADAIALTRGDRFFTTDMTPHNYTSWGLRDCARQNQPILAPGVQSSPGFGSVLGRLFLRTLPGCYTTDSVYTWFPLHTPDAMQGFLKNLMDRKDKKELSWYSYDRPGGAREVGNVVEYEVVRAVLGSDGIGRDGVERVTESAFRPPYADRVRQIVKGEGFFIALDETPDGVHNQRIARELLLYSSSPLHPRTSPLPHPSGFVATASGDIASIANGTHPTNGSRVPTAKHLPTHAPEASSPSFARILHFFLARTRQVVARDAYVLRRGEGKAHGREGEIWTVDVAGALKRVCVRWVAEEVAAIGLKSEDNSSGTYTEDELQEVLASLYEYMFLETNPAKIYELQQQAVSRADKLLETIHQSLRGVTGSRFSLFGIVDTISHFFKPSHSRRDSSFSSSSPNTSDAHTFLHRLAAHVAMSNKSTDELAHIVLAVVIGSSVELSQAMVNMVNLYLEPERSGDLERIKGLIRKGGVEGEKGLEAYAREAIRIDPPFAGVYRRATKDTQAGDLAVKADDTLFLSIYSANRDERVFPKATTVNVDRPLEDYIVGDGISTCLGTEFMYKTMAQVLKAVFSLKNIRRAPGAPGTLKRFPYNTAETEYYQYLDKNMDPIPWATTLILQYDE